MKRTYVKPELEITEFETENVITTSDTVSGTGEDGGED